MSISVEELAAIIGAKEIEIVVLRKQLADAQRRIAELEKKPESGTP